ncbi:MAG TPA: AAA family ATPase [Gemmatimonadaceae bacterium]
MSPLPSPFPLVGRESELALLSAALDRAGAGEGGTLLLQGEGGIGKTRLVRVAADDAARRNWSVAFGRAYPVESGVPYALFADAFLPILRELDTGQLTLLTRGHDAELAALFPALGTARAGAVADGTDLKARLLWTFAQLARRLAAKRPLLVVLENLQWADASSLELLHFLARQIAGERVLVVGTYNSAERDLNPVLRGTEQSLVAIGAARTHEVGPLSHDATVELLHRVGGADRAATREFAALLYGWTRGNPFFVEETLKALVAAGRLVERDGRWEGWTLERLDLPRSIREALLARLGRLGAEARLVANLAAVLGSRVRHDILGAVSGLADEELLAAIDELRRQRVLVESVEGGEVRYDFEHPMVRETLYAELGLARARKLHAVVAEALERRYGADAAVHADELAFHFARADARAAGPKAVRYLRAAGREALAKYANREAASYLETALELLDGAADAEAPNGTAPAGESPGEPPDVLAEDLARARQRLGEYDAAMALWRRARGAAERSGDPARVARIERRMGLASYWSGHYTDALAHYEAGLADAAASGDEGLLAQLRLAKGNCLLALGQHAAAEHDVRDALAIAERLGDEALLARTHRALLLLHTWTGPADLAREHGERAVALAAASGQRFVGWSAHWALAMLEGLTSNAPAIARHIAESERLADELRSPLLRVWTAEVAVEYKAGIGEWDEAIALGEGSIATARALSQRTLLPRLLVWTGLIHLARNDTERAHAHLEEAWRLAGADGGGGRPLDVHTVVPAHTGMVAWHIARGEHRRAIEIGRAGLEIADRSGYVVWAIYRLLPLVIEAALWSEDFDVARELEARLRSDSARLGHALGLAWADTCLALIAMLQRNFEEAGPRLESAVAALDRVPFVFDAARLRCRLAYALANLGDREGAMRELRQAHDVFARLGARRELDKTRSQMRGLGARPPVRAAPAAAGGNGLPAAGALTGRELDIARLVARRKSNKEIGVELGISSRTVSTHLSNIFGKLGVGSRGELADLARDAGWLAARQGDGAE